MSVASEVRAACRRDSGDRELRQQVLESVRRAVAFDAYVWVVTDPATAVGSSPLADVPARIDLPTVIRLRYQDRDSRWTRLQAGEVVSWTRPDSGPDAGSEWRRHLAGWAIADVATVAFRDDHGIWGFLDLWRSTGAFTRAELGILGGALAPVATALRRRQAAAFSTVVGDRPGGPGVLLLAPDLTVRRQTAATDAVLRALLPTPDDRQPVPAAAYNVAAQLLAVESGVDDRPAQSRTWSTDGLLLTFRAARLQTQDRPAAEADIAVTVEPTTPASRLDLFCRVHGLTPREAEVLGCLAGGDDTRAVAGRLYLSEYTVQDHLTAIFDKAGVRSRRALLARATG